MKASRCFMLLISPERRGSTDRIASFRGRAVSGLPLVLLQNYSNYKSSFISPLFIIAIVVPGNNKKSGQVKSASQVRFLFGLWVQRLQS